MDAGNHLVGGGAAVRALRNRSEATSALKSLAFMTGQWEPSPAGHHALTLSQNGPNTSTPLLRG
jgi:hypothetical protein